MPQEKLVFATSVEALFVRELGASLGDRARRRLREVGLDLEHPLEVAYPLAQWKAFVHLAAETVYPNLSPAEMHWWMGIHYLQGFLQTFTGRILADLAPALGPRRMLERLGQDLRSGNNFSEVRLVEIAPRHVELWMNDVMDDSPSFAAGFILRAQQLAGARNVHVDTWSFDGTACTFEIRWRDAATGPDLQVR